MKTFRYSVVAIGLVMVANVALLRAQEDDAAPSAVDELTLKQSQLADKYQKLEDLIFNMADFEARENPQRAALLKEAYRQSKDRLTLSALNSVVESLERNSLKKAVETQETVKGDLSALLELLMSENRSDRLKSKSQRLKEYIKELKRFLNTMDLFLQVFGPSMLPAILALGLHNGAIIAHLLGRQAGGLALRADAPRGLTLWGWEIVPRLFGQFVALCLYRWEIIIRESAIVGILGVATLGFYLDDAISQLRLDRAVLILLATGMVTVAIDALSRFLRSGLGAGRLRARAASERGIALAAEAPG